MKKFREILMTGFAVVIGAAVVKYGIYEYKQYSQINAIDSTLQEVKGKLDSAVTNDTSDRTDSEKLYDASQDMMSERLSNVSKNSANDKDKAFAAGVFAGQYGRMVIFTAEYCKTLGVDISEFSNSYKESHKELYVKADAILKEGGGNIIKTYQSTRELILPYIKKEVSDIKTMFITQTDNNSFTLADSCEYYNQIARDSETMNSVKFSSVAPDPFRILIGNK